MWGRSAEFCRDDESILQPKWDKYKTRNGREAICAYRETWAQSGKTQPLPKLLKKKNRARGTLKHRSNKNTLNRTMTSKLRAAPEKKRTDVTEYQAKNTRKPENGQSGQSRESRPRSKMGSRYRETWQMVPYYTYTGTKEMQVNVETTDPHS